MRPAHSFGWWMRDFPAAAEKFGKHFSLFILVGRRPGIDRGRFLHYSTEYSTDRQTQ
jgi:hypothetical protein